MIAVEEKLNLAAKPGMQFGLERMQYFLSWFHHPEEKIKAIHVGGTNGKGSTVNFLRMLLQEAGYRIGTFTSPAVLNFYEQIAINGYFISEQELQILWQRLYPCIKEMQGLSIGGPTQFEMLTMLAILFFAEYAKPDFCIFEVGLGGETDSTNVICPILTMITTISLEHTQILGNTIQEIAAKKAGIIKPNVPFLTTVQSPEAQAVLQIAADKKSAPFFPVSLTGFVMRAINFMKTEVRCTKEGPLLNQSFFLRMPGLHQVQNAVLALHALWQLQHMESFSLCQEKIFRALEQTVLPGRMEIGMSPYVYLLDGAHNIEGIEKLTAAVQTYLPNMKKKLLFSASSDKNHQEMIYKLHEITDDIGITTFGFYRSLSETQAVSLATYMGIKYVKDYKDWLQDIPCENDQVVIITGSLYFISEVRNFLHSLGKEVC